MASTMELEPIEVPSASASSAPAAASASSTSNTNTTTSANPFDLETYIARYSPASETRLQRLLLVGSVSPSSETARHAYRMAERQCRDNLNARTYRMVFGQQQPAQAAAVGAAAGSGSGEASAGGGTDGSLPPSSSSVLMIPPDLLDGSALSSSNLSNTNSASTASTLPASLFHPPARHGLSYDPNFATTAAQTSALHLQTLEARLSQAQSHLAKDAIRTAYLALAEHHRLRGDLRESLRKLLRSRDYCTSTRQSGAVCLSVIELGVDMRNFSLVKDYVSKAEHTTDLLHTDPLFAARLRAAAGLAHLSEGRYADAARKMAAVHSELTNQFSTVLSAEDIALYGALLGMAALERSELHDLILDSAAFKSRLELVPALKEALRHYVLAEYGPALSLLTAHVRPLLDLDIHLRPHAEVLLGMIRDRCVVQYFAPYSKVSLVAMGDCFQVSPAEMEEIVAGLLRSGKMGGGGGARINSLQKTLVAATSAQYQRRRKVETRRKIGRLGRTFVDEADSMVLRLSCVENGLVVSEGGRRGGFGGGGGGIWGAAGGGRRGRGAGGRSRGLPSLGGGGDADAAAMMMAYGIDDDSSSDDDGGHPGGGDELEPGIDDAGEEEMMMDVDDYANPEGGI